MFGPPNKSSASNGLKDFQRIHRSIMITIEYWILNCNKWHYPLPKKKIETLFLFEHKIISLLITNCWNSLGVVNYKDKDYGFNINWSMIKLQLAIKYKDYFVIIHPFRTFAVSEKLNEVMWSLKKIAGNICVCLQNIANISLPPRASKKTIRLCVLNSHECVFRALCSPYSSCLR